MAMTAEGEAEEGTCVLYMVILANGKRGEISVHSLERVTDADE